MNENKNNKVISNHVLISDEHIEPGMFVAMNTDGKVVVGNELIIKRFKEDQK